jgi:hypothetical protein
MGSRQPICIGRFGNLSGRQPKRVDDGFRFRGNELTAVELDKAGRQHKARAFVPIDEWVIADNP